jgi:hypothetical protein
MFKLAEGRTSRGGVYCGKEGLYLSAVPLVERDGEGRYLVRPAAEIETLLAAAYETPPDIERCLAGLQRVAEHLSAGNLPLAMIAAVQLNLPDIAEGRIERLARTAALLKANFNSAEPRDAQGRWTDDDDAGGGVGSSGGTIPTSSGRSGGGAIPTSAGGNGPAISRAWENYPNADFRNRLADAERTGDKKNFGYGEVHNSTDPSRIALGRYQLTQVSLKASGMMDRNGNWTGKYGIHSRAEFLADPEAQEKALTDYLNDNERQLRADGAFAHIGETFNGLKARFSVTRAGIIAAAHREGALATKDYLNRIAGHGFTSKGLGLSPKERAIETRLRTFSGARYE